MNSPFENHSQWILHNTLDAVIVIDEAGVVIEWNRQSESTFGWRRDEAIGKPVAELIIPQSHRQAHRQGLEHFLQTGEGPVLNKRVELTALHKDGNEFPIELAITPSQTESGWRFAAFARDISERIRREQVEAKLAAIVSSSTDAIIGKELDGTITSWNRAAEELYGYTADEMIGQNIQKIVPPDRNNELQAILVGLAVGRNVPPTETVRVHRDGTRLNISLSVSPVKDSKGAIVSASATARDITSETAARERAIEQQATIAAILNSTASGIYGIDLSGNCNFANPACAELLGYDSPDEFLGKNMHDLIHHSYADGSSFSAQQCPIYTSLQKGAAVRIEDEVLWRKDGSSFYAEYWSHPIYREKTHVGAVVSFHDISDRKALEAIADEHLVELEEKVRERTQKLAAANKALIKSNEDLTNFASHASHDLQSPLRGIAGFANFLKEDFYDDLNEDGREFIDRINANVERMQQLINDLLEFSRIDRQHKPPAQVDFNRVVQGALEMVQGEGEGAEIVYSDLPIVWGDEAQLRQLMSNIIGNAIKYCENDTPQVKIAAQRTETDSGWRISVTDNGIGIDPEFHDRIFKVFQRLHTASAYSGTGIGLAICQRIIERHDGTIGVDSTPGKGSTFFFTLPDRA